MILLRILWLRLVAWSFDWRIDADNEELLRRSREGSASDAWAAQTVMQVQVLQARRDWCLRRIASLRAQRPKVIPTTPAARIFRALMG